MNGHLLSPALGETPSDLPTLRQDQQIEVGEEGLAQLWVLQLEEKLAVPILSSLAQALGSSHV